MSLYEPSDSRYQTSFGFICFIHMAMIAITGGTGMIGTALSSHLAARDHQVLILTRDPLRYKAKGNISYAGWDPERQTIDASVIQSSDHLIHLAGANVGARRWTSKRKKEIMDSRVQSGVLLVKAIGDQPNQLKSVISASGTGYYGPDPVIPNPSPFVEEDRPGNDFLASVVEQWEAAISPVRSFGKRLVIFRA